jgi:ATP-binding cassette, subfamily B, multidrug efflux pump
MAEFKDIVLEERLQRRMLTGRLALWTFAYFKPYKADLILGIVFVLVSSALALFTPLVLKDTINGLQSYSRLVTEERKRPLGYDSPEEREARIAEIRREAHYDVLFVQCGAMAALIAMACAANIFTFRIIRRTGRSALRDMRNQVFKHLQRLSMSYYDRQKAGQIIARVDSDVETLEAMLTRALPDMIANILMLAAVLCIMIMMNRRLGLILAISAPLLAFSAWFYKRWAMPLYRNLRRMNSRVVAELAENVEGVRIVQAYTRQDANLASYQETTQQFLALLVKARLLPNIYGGWLGLVRGAAWAVTLIIGADLVWQTEMALGDHFIYIFLLDMVFQPIIKLGELYDSTMASGAAAERISAVLDTQPIIRNRDNPVRMESMQGRVDFRRVFFRYTTHDPVAGNRAEGQGADEREWTLKDIDFTAEPGRTIALVGPTGAGKSSIINLVARFYDVQQGDVLIDGVNIKDVSLESLHEHTGIVLQESFLFTGSVLDNIRYGRPQATEAEVRAAVDALGCLDVIDRIGLHTQVRQRGVGLSHGERQLVTFCRAMLANPRILILDEATSAVDTATERRIQDALRQLIRHRTTFVIAHRLSTVRSADLVLVVDHGEIVERGTHYDLMEMGGKYARLYREFTREADGN